MIHMIRPLSRTTILLAGLSALPLIWTACSTPAALPAPTAAPAEPMDTYVAHRDAELGVPTFVWLDGQPHPGSDARTVAWQVLHELAPTYGLSDDALQNARL